MPSYELEWLVLLVEANALSQCTPVLFGMHDTAAQSIARCNCHKHVCGCPVTCLFAAFCSTCKCGAAGERALLPAELGSHGFTRNGEPSFADLQQVRQGFLHIWGACGLSAAADAAKAPPMLVPELDPDSEQPIFRDGSPTLDSGKRYVRDMPYDWDYLVENIIGKAMESSTEAKSIRCLQCMVFCRCCMQQAI